LKRLDLRLQRRDELRDEQLDLVGLRDGGLRVARPRRGFCCESQQHRQAPHLRH